MASVKVANVRTSAGESVTLVFEDTGVVVLDRSAPQSRLFRLAGLMVFAAVALGFAAVGVGHTVNVRVGLWLAAGAATLVAGSALIAAAAGFVAARTLRQARNGTGSPTLTADAVVWGRSDQQRGRVTVTLGLKDGTSREFSAYGMAGAQMAQQFGTLLGAVEPAETILPEASKAS